ncbi:MAG: outer rane lipoprotein carrier protein [Chthoniobacter sp.]|jgi:outer membrane lipoprotein-sorting protein|nr:outer rane lipoprotein carrier protein [Chthoniobacter sp.]
MRTLYCFLLFLALTDLRASEPLDLTPVKRWITRQDDFRAVTADFTQTRALRALRSPLASEGRLWFKAPESFRWEVGKPAKTIVLRKGDFIYVIQPGKKHAERTPAGTVSKNAGAQGFGMMNFPFARDFADFQKQFETLAISTEGNRCHLEVLPRDPRARKFLAALKLDFNTANGHLMAFELATRDGSSLRNEFTNVQVNPKIDRSVFDFDLTGFEVVDAKQ